MNDYWTKIILDRRLKELREDAAAYRLAHPRGAEEDLPTPRRARGILNTVRAMLAHWQRPVEESFRSTANFEKEVMNIGE